MHILFFVTALKILLKARKYHSTEVLEAGIGRISEANISLLML